MKKIYSLIFAILLISTATLRAKTQVHQTTVSFLNKTDQLDLKLDLGDLSKMSQKDIDVKINKFITENVPKNAVLQCSVTVKGTVSVGVATVEISVTVSGTCDEIAKAGSQIANQVLNAVKKAYSQIAN